MIFALIAMFAAAAAGLAIAVGRPRDFALFLLPMGVFEFSASLDSGVGAQGGGLANTSAIWLLLLLLVSVVAVSQIGAGGFSLNLPEMLYLCFLSWCILETVRAGDRGFAIRSFLRLLFPFLSMYLARRTITDARMGDRLLRYQFLATFCAMAVAWGVAVAPRIFFVLTTIVWYGAVILDQCVLIALLALATWKVTWRLRPLIFAAMLVMLCFVAVNRTTLLALVVGGSVFCLLEYRRFSVILLPSLYVGMGAVVMLVPSFRQKMFFQPDKVQSSVILSTNVLSNEQFNNDGRYAMWTEILDRFYRPNRIMGSGLGATQAWFYSGGAEEVLHTKLKVEHCEYVKMAADTGLVGVILYMGMHVSAFWLALVSYRRATTPQARIFSIAAACALPAFWVCMAFDNALLYVLPVAQLPTSFAAIASSLSLQKRGSRPAPQPAAAHSNGAMWIPRRQPGERFAPPVEA